MRRIWAISTFHCFPTAVNVGRSYQPKPPLATADVLFHRLRPVSAGTTYLRFAIWSLRAMRSQS